MIKFRYKEFLLLLILVLGVQFCSPMPADAGQLQQMAIENLSKKEGLDTDLNLKLGPAAMAVIFITFCYAPHFDFPAASLSTSDTRIYGKILPVSGLFPSAP